MLMTVRRSTAAQKKDTPIIRSSSRSAAPRRRARSHVDGGAREWHNSVRRMGSLCDAADRNVVCDLHRGIDYRSLDQLGTVLKTRPVKITKKDPCLNVRTNPFLVVLPARCDVELDGEGRKHR